MPAKDHDLLFRSTFTDLRHARPLLRRLLPEAIAATCDWDSLRVLPGSFVDSDLREYHTDILFGIECQGTTLLLHLLLEHKAYADRYTALQVLRYVVRIHEGHLQQGAQDAALPPVLPIVLYHGRAAWRAPVDTLQLFRLEGLSPAARQALMPFQANLRFLLVELAKDAEEPGVGDGSSEVSLTPIGALTLLLLQHVRQAGEQGVEGLVRRWLPLWQSAWRDAIERLALLSLLNYMVSQLATSPDQIFVAVAMIHEDAIPMAKTIKEQWMAEGKAEVLLRQMRRRFGELPPEAMERIQRAGVDQLEHWLDRILDARTLGELLDHAGS